MVRGTCSLRQAINTANGVPGADTINFDAGLSGQTIPLIPALGELSISSNITIDALAVANVLVSGGGTNRMTASTVSGNSAGGGFIFNDFRGGGGGLLVESATIYVSNSAVSGNSSGCECGGGGITTYNGGATTNLRNVTVANNTASARMGGGVVSFISGFPAGTTKIGNSIVADNTASVANNDVDGAIVSQGFNLVRSRGTSTGYVASDLPDNSNPMLDALGSYGGATQTQRLLAGSQAIDKGSNALAVDPFNNVGSGERPARLAAKL